MYVAELYSEGSYEEAVQLYSEAIALCPVESSAPFYGNRSAALLMLKQYAKCQSDCVRARELDPSFAKVYARSAKVHMLLGEYEQAKQVLDEQAARTATKPSEKEMRDVEQSLQRLKQLHMTLANKSYSSALYQVEVMLKDSPDSVVLRVIQCDCQIQLKKFEQAKAVATELYKVDARNSEVLRVRGLSLYYSQSTHRVTERGRRF